MRKHTNRQCDALTTGGVSLIGNLVTEMLEAVVIDDNTERNKGVPVRPWPQGEIEVTASYALLQTSVDSFGHHGQKCADDPQTI